MILVIDHDPEVLEKAHKILNRERQVFLASSAHDALQIINHEGADFSVVLVDLDLPGDGYALIRRIHASHPDLLIIAVHGASKVSIDAATRPPGVVEVLNKPISPHWKPVVERVRAQRFRPR